MKRLCWHIQASIIIIYFPVDFKSTNVMVMLNSMSKINENYDKAEYRKPVAFLNVKTTYMPKRVKSFNILQYKEILNNST